MKETFQILPQQQCSYESYVIPHQEPWTENLGAQLRPSTDTIYFMLRSSPSSFTVGFHEKTRMNRGTYIFIMNVEGQLYSEMEGVGVD